MDIHESINFITLNGCKKKGTHVAEYSQQTWHLASVFIDCRIKTCLSLKRRAILKITSTVS